MRTTNEGVNSFTSYPSVKFYIDYLKRGYSIKSLELSWGGYAHFDADTLKADIRNYDVFIRRFFHHHIKDGYYTDKIIYVNNIPDNLYVKHSSLWFPKVFLFLEEEYEKKFVVEYLKTLFEPLADYHTNHKSILFQHYDRRGSKNNKSISRPA